MSSGFVRCDNEFEEIGEDLDMSTFGISSMSLTPPMEYCPPDIAKELAMLEEYQRKEKTKVLDIGTKVIVRTCKEYGGRLTGKIGTVVQVYTRADKLGIKFEDVRNPESKNGVFWVPDKCVTPYMAPTAMLNADDVQRVIFSKTKTIILWKDGVKTIATCGEGDSFDPYAGFCAAVAKRVFGSTSKAKKILKVAAQDK